MKDIDKPSACAICGKLPAPGRFLIEGEACECYCRAHAARLQRFLDGISRLSIAELEEQTRMGRQLQ